MPWIWATKEQVITKRPCKLFNVIMTPSGADGSIWIHDGESALDPPIGHIFTSIQVTREYSIVSGLETHRGLYVGAFDHVEGALVHWEPLGEGRAQRSVVFYDYSFTISANTAEASPKRQDVKLTHGIIHRVEIGFPGGCAGLVHLQIKHGLHQVWPTNPDGSFNSDNYTITINEYQPLKTQPYILTLTGWNLDDTFNHTIEVRIGILPERVLMPEASFTAAFKKLMSRLRI